MNLEWTKEKPKKIGIYFRNTPGTPYIMKFSVCSFAKKLCINIWGDYKIIELMDEDYWWYGPIPDPPNFKGKISDV